MPLERIKMTNPPPPPQIPRKFFSSHIADLVNTNRQIKVMYDNKEISDDELNFAATCFLELGNMLKRMVDNGQT